MMLIDIHDVRLDRGVNVLPYSELWVGFKMPNEMSIRNEKPCNKAKGLNVWNSDIIIVIDGPVEY